MKDKENDVIDTLINADQIRESRSDSSVLLYYKEYGKNYICVVVKLNNGEGFIITTYMTENIKEGRRIWQK